MQKVELDYLSKSYASMIFDQACKLNIEAKVLKEICSINEIINKFASISDFFYSPVVCSKKKSNLINLISNKFCITYFVINFIVFLINKMHLYCLHKIIINYRNLLNYKNNIVTVDIIYSRQLSEQDRDWIKKYLYGIIITKELLLNFICDKSILGGIIIKYDDVVLDYSLRYKLYSIQSAMQTAQINLL